MADEIITGYRDAEDEYGGDDATLSTVASWHAMTQAHGEELKEDDWIVLVQELAKRLMEATNGND